MEKITKKSILPIVALLGLVSCGGNSSEIQPEVAKQRAQKIVEKQNSEDFEVPKRLYVESTTIVDEKGEVSGTATPETVTTTTSLISCDLAFQRFCIINETKAIQNGTIETYSSGSKTWLYVEDNVFYYATEAGSSKICLKTTITDKSQFNFESAISSSYAVLYSTITNQSALDLDQYAEALPNYFSQQMGFVFDTTTVSYTSTGEGNLGITQKAYVDTLNNTISQKATVTGTIQFENYFLSSITYVGNATESEGDRKLEVSLNGSSNVYLNQEKFSKPDLSSFTIVNQ